MQVRTRAKGQIRLGLFGRVIRSTAQATAEEVISRIRGENAWEHWDARLSPCGLDESNSSAQTVKGEVEHLLRMYDELLKFRDYLDARAGASRRRRWRLQHELRLIASLIERILERLKASGITVMPFPDSVDYRLHEPVRTVPSANEADEGKVIDVYISGFLNGRHVVRPAKVAVLKFVPKPKVQSKEA